MNDKIDAAVHRILEHSENYDSDDCDYWVGSDIDDGPQDANRVATACIRYWNALDDLKTHFEATGAWTASVRALIEDALAEPQ